MNDLKERRRSSLSFENKINIEEEAARMATRELLQGRKSSIQIPLFHGEFDPDSYNDWENELEFIFARHNYTAEKRFRVAIKGLYGYALDWWNQVANTRRRTGEQQVSCWFEMKTIMKKRFIAKCYGQTDLKRLHSPSSTAWALPREEKYSSIGASQRGVKQSSPKRAVRKTQPKLIVETPSARTEKKRKDGVEKWLQEIKEQVLKRIRNPCPSTALEEDEEAKDIETQLSDVSVPVESMDVQLHPKDEPEAISVLLPVQNVAEEVVAIGPKADHEKNHTMVCSSGAFHEPFVCEFLIKPIIWIKNSLVEQLRHIKGLRHIVFEPGRVSYEFKGSNHILKLKTASVKLNLKGLFTHEDQGVRLNVLEGKEISSNIRRGSGNNTFMVCSATFRHKLIHQVEECAVGRNHPKLKKEYGCGFTRPPDLKKTSMRVCGHMSKKIMHAGSKFLALEAAGFQESYIKCTWHEKGLQYYVFEPGGNIFINEIVLQERLDLRTNPFKGGGNDAILTSLFLRQQANRVSCLENSFDEGAFKVAYLSDQRELGNKVNCYGKLTHQSIFINWSHQNDIKGLRVMEFTIWMNQDFRRTDISSLRRVFRPNQKGSGYDTKCFRFLSHQGTREKWNLLKRRWE